MGSRGTNQRLVQSREHPGEEGGFKGGGSAGECVRGERGWGQEAQTKGWSRVSSREHPRGSAGECVCGERGWGQEAQTQEGASWGAKEWVGGGGGLKEVALQECVHGERRLN